MAMYLRFLAVLLLLCLTASATGAVEVMEAVGTLAMLEATVHELLPQYGLPKGLLPDSVTSYSLSGNGEFEVELKAPCYVKFTDFVYYERRIKGRLSYGAISDLSGIQAKKFFVWLPVTGIVAHPAEGTVVFEVGFLSESLPVSLFETIPVCKAKAKAACRGAAGLLPDADVIPISISDSL